MKTLKYAFAVALMGSASHAFAQYQVDALRNSQSQPIGTARTLGIGGAGAAIGGDYGAVGINPAGLGMFQRSEISFSPGVSFLNTSSQGFGTTTSESRNNLNVASLGMVFAHRRPDGDPSPWRAGAFSLGLIRTADFNQRFRYDGNPPQNQDFFQRLDEDHGGALDELAYNTFLTDSINGERRLSDPFLATGFGDQPLRQGETVNTTGANTQVDIAYGASYQDKFYIGGGVGIVLSRYSTERITTVVDPQTVTDEEATSFGSLRLRSAIDTRGTGINARLGLIYRPVDALRIGASIQTPTYFQFDETYNASLQAQFDKPIKVGNQTYSSASDAIDAEQLSYTLTTPFRATGGISAVIGKYGFLSGDVEYLNYSQAHLANNANGSFANSARDFGGDNDAVSSLYSSAVNVRLGGELRLDVLRVRAGFAHYGDPYRDVSVSQGRNYFTGGLGLRQGNFFLDVAGVYAQSKQLYSPYTLFVRNTKTPVVEVNSKPLTTTITAGILF
ncbi:hypothetical protein CDA63_02490 [Hymenobacter amundsenii]|uniref:Aromatic hydrocarbon degradation protein n=1 Tax=Hymenobacter amundsenii TaxID=2006685 RepID=A0A246FPG2_9BACT|nr:hypothetical protein [Hymenobacter amundsenii]OWP64646.1 hypothetical protein CDA63_02490 [Hymenobacter amundsenii]